MSGRALAPTIPQLIFSHWEIAEPSGDALGPLLGAAVYAGLYLWGVARVGAAGSRRSAGAHRAWPRSRTCAFMAGILVVLVALESGIDAYDDRLLSVHMAQHLLLLLVAPGLLLAGQPSLLLLRALPPDQRRYVGRRLIAARGLTGPLVCLSVLWAAVLGTHLAAFYDLTLRDQTVHDGEHLLYLLAGLLLWWPLVDGDPAAGRRLDGLQRLAYVFAAMPPMAFVGAFLNRNDTLVYTPYRAPSLALGVNPLTDQAQAGALMWVGGGTLLAAVALVTAWRALVLEEQRQRRRERYADQPAGAGR